MHKIVLAAVVALVLWMDSCCGANHGIVAYRKSPNRRSIRFLNVMRFGAKGDGRTDDSQAFTAAWTAACRSPYPTQLSAPSGKRFLLNPITFAGPCKSPISFKISGTILAPWGTWDINNNPFWLVFFRVSSLTITGRGNINGRGQNWWQQSCKTNPNNPCLPPPTAMTIIQCFRVNIRNLRFINSQQFHLALSQSVGVKVSGLTIVAPETSPNTDGIHLFQSSHVSIKNSIIGTGDDCISVGNGCSNVLINNIKCGPGHGIGIGSLGKDGETARVERIHVSGVSFHGTSNGVRIKTWQGGNGYAKHIVFRNITLEDVTNPIIIDQYYCDSSQPCQNKSSAVQIQDVGYHNIRGTAVGDGNFISFKCSKNTACEGILMSNVNIRYPKNLISKIAAPTACFNAYGAILGPVVPPSCLNR